MPVVVGPVQPPPRGPDQPPPPRGPDQPPPPRGPDQAVAAARCAVRDALADLAGSDLVSSDLASSDLAGSDLAGGDLAPGGAGDGAAAAGRLVIVACSGGPDSLALAAATAFVAARLGLRAGAVVVDHDLQPGSRAVADRAAATCRDLGLDPVDVQRVQVAASGGGGPEARARRARHEALRAVAARHGASAVLLGHTRDDQAETVLLRLARGSGARSLAGIAPRAGLLRRPLLDLTRADTMAACAAAGLEPWRDPSNDDPGQARSRVRHGALPALVDAVGPGAATGLARSAAMLREDADALDALAGDLAAELGLDPGGPGGARSLAAADLAPAPAALRLRVLRAAAVAAGAPPGALTRGHAEALDALVTRWRGQGPVHLPGGVEGRRHCGTLVLHRPAQVGAPDPPRGPGADAPEPTPDEESAAGGRRRHG